LTRHSLFTYEDYGDGLTEPQEVRQLQCHTDITIVNVDEVAVERIVNALEIAYTAGQWVSDDDTVI
jgi:hypothetical protein